MPATIEERVAYLEGKVEEHTTGLRDVREMFVHLDGRMLSLEQKITEINKRVDETNKRIDETNKRIDEINKRIDETNKRIDETNKRIDEVRDMLSARVDKLFYFIMATLISSVGTFVAIIVSILARK